MIILRNLYKLGDTVKNTQDSSEVILKIIGEDKYNYICEIINPGNHKWLNSLLPKVSGEKTGTVQVVYKGTVHRNFKKLGFLGILKDPSQKARKQSGCTKFVPPNYK